MLVLDDCCSVMLQCLSMLSKLLLATTSHEQQKGRPTSQRCKEDCQYQSTKATHRPYAAAILPGIRLSCRGTLLSCCRVPLLVHESLPPLGIRLKSHKCAK